MSDTADIAVEVVAERLYIEHLLANPRYPQIPWSKRINIVRDAWRDHARKVLFEGTIP